MAATQGIAMSGADRLPDYPLGSGVARRLRSALEARDHEALRDVVCTQVRPVDAVIELANDDWMKDPWAPLPAGVLVGNRGESPVCDSKYPVTCAGDRRAVLEAGGGARGNRGPVQAAVRPLGLCVRTGRAAPNKPLERGKSIGGTARRPGSFSSPSPARPGPPRAAPSSKPRGPRCDFGLSCPVCHVASYRLNFSRLLS